MAYQNNPEKKKVPSYGKTDVRNIPSKQAFSQYKNPLSYETENPSWSFKRISKEYMWLFNSEDLLSHNNNIADPKCVLAKLSSFEGLTWREIKVQTHDRGRSSNHFIEDLSKLCKPAQKRLKDLKIDGNLFSLRLENTTRIFGILESKTLEILWYDTKHEIYPIDK